MSCVKPHGSLVWSSHASFLGENSLRTPAAFQLLMRAALTTLAAVLLSQRAAPVAARRLRHRRRWRASRLASRRSPFNTHTLLPDARNCSWKTLSQKLDHFGSLSTTFDQRLCLYADFATNNVTRVLLYVGNESPVEEYVNNTGLMYDLGVPRCCGAFTPSTRVVSRRGGRGWFLFRI